MLSILITIFIQQFKSLILAYVINTIRDKKIFDNIK